MSVVAVAMSGGVDSSVTAALLKQKHDVFGMTMLLHKYSYDAIESAANICKQIGIEHHVIDLQNQFKQKVIEMFKNEYNAGKTPNPCCICNREIKMGLFLQQALLLGADFMATGHYANNTHHLLEESKNLSKDQTYFLSLVAPEHLKHIMFPLGGFQNKAEIRKIAQDMKLVVAQKPDSQNICFIPHNYKMIMTPKRGNIIDIETGKVLGQHNGAFHYTIGQRKGLGISSSKPLYVVKINNNDVFVGDCNLLKQNTFTISSVNKLEQMDNTTYATVKIRSSCEKIPAIIEFYEDNARITLQSDKHAAIAPGQICAIYKQNYVIAGGIID